MPCVFVDAEALRRLIQSSDGMLDVGQLAGETRNLQRIEGLVVSVGLMRRVRCSGALVGGSIRLGRALAEPRQRPNDALSFVVEPRSEVIQLLLIHDNVPERLECKH